MWVSTTLRATTSLTNCSQYDDLFTVPGEGLITPVGVYQGISYENIDVASASILNESADGLIPHSDPNVAILVTTSTTPPTLTAQYSDSKTKSFSLSSVYYGCAAQTLQGVVSAAVACNITVTGYTAGSSTTQTFRFVPDEPVDVMNPLAFGTFSAKFQNLQSATFSVSPPLGAGAFIDNLVGSTQS